MLSQSHILKNISMPKINDNDHRPPTTDLVLSVVSEKVYSGLRSLYQWSSITPPTILWQSNRTMSYLKVLENIFYI